MNISSLSLSLSVETFIIAFYYWFEAEVEFKRKKQLGAEHRCCDFSFHFNSIFCSLELPTERFLVQFGFLDTHTREWVPISPWNFISLESRDRETVHFFLALLLPALPHRLLAGANTIEERLSESGGCRRHWRRRRYNLSSLLFHPPRQKAQSIVAVWQRWGAAFYSCCCCMCVAPSLVYSQSDWEGKEIEKW